MKKIFTICWCLSGFIYLSGQTVAVEGIVLGDRNQELDSVAVVLNDETTVFTNTKGSYQLEVPANEPVSLLFKKQGYYDFTIDSTFAPGAVREMNVKMESPRLLVRRKDKAIGGNIISPDEMENMPTVTGGDLLGTFADGPGGELSTQYVVRGGNYDENLIHINGIEIYRPLLGRSGEQEGMSFMNPNMIKALEFSSGGWESKYGDKLSSSLNLLYRKPRKAEVAADASFMGGSLTFGDRVILDQENPRHKNLSALVSARYQNRNLVLNTLDEDTDFNPVYFDVQSYINLNLSKRFSLDLIANFAQNDFAFQPNTRSVRFGTTTNPIELNVVYDGNENDAYQTTFGALTGSYLSDNKRLALAGDVFVNHVTEQEYFDILGSYAIVEQNENGGTSFTREVARQLDHARNDLDYLVAGFQHRGKFELKGHKGPHVEKPFSHQLEWGFKYQNEDVRDRLSEWQLIDSAGYSLPAPPFTPGEPYNFGDLVVNYNIQAQSSINTNRFSAYFQYQREWVNRKKALFQLNTGLRATYWDFNEELNISPRLQILFRPNWKREMDFWLAGGFYYQPPFYKEIRNQFGQLQNDTKSQRSIHLTLGNMYPFEMLQRKFKLTTELYYKKLDDLIPYFIDNVRIRYTAENNSEGFIYGADARLEGEIVEGAESWLRLSYTRAKESIDGRGYIPRPTDQRFRVAFFYQDYMPEFPWMKASLRLVYANGLPNGAPLLSDPYDFQSYLSDYKRVDLGLTALIIDRKSSDLEEDSYFMSKVKKLSIGLEVFNVFDISNTVSNQYIRDVSNNDIYAVPNRLTGRFFNLRLAVKL